MRKAQFVAGVVGLAAVTWAQVASAEEKKSWYDSAPEDEEEDQEEESGDGASQEEGEADTDSRMGGFLTPGTIALMGGVHLGMGGNLAIEAEGLDSEYDLAATIGLQLGAEYVVHAYFAAGAELRLSGVNSKVAAEREVGRDMFIDLVVKPRGRYVIESIGLETFVTLPMGVSFPNISDEKSGDAGVGFAFGAGLGASYFFTEKLGISSDFTWLWHWYGIEDVNQANNDKYEGDVKLSQFTWFINAVYAL
jgi:hypothetical protein